MKIWVAKNSEVPVRDQLVTQITLGIAAGDFEIGERLPSTREIARRCGLHPNTVGFAYQKLVDQNLLEFRKGSGFYVAESASEQIEGSRKLEQLIDEVLAAARSLGIDNKDVIDKIRRRSRTVMRPGRRILLVESDPGLREILMCELSEKFDGVRGMSLAEFSTRRVIDAVVTAMLDEKPKLDAILNDGDRCFYLKGRSVSAAMSSETRPGPDEVVSVVSGWDGFLTFARIMLLAANLPPGNIIIRSVTDENWEQAIRGSSMIICDTLTARRMDGRESVRPFRIISDESLSELADIMSAHDAANVTN